LGIVGCSQADPDAGHGYQNGSADQPGAVDMAGSLMDTGWLARRQGSICRKGMGTGHGDRNPHRNHPRPEIPHSDSPEARPSGDVMGCSYWPNCGPTMALLGRILLDLQMNNLARTGLLLFSFCFAGRQEQVMKSAWTF
jgi:hypothetical protein